MPIMSFPGRVWMKNADGKFYDGLVDAKNFGDAKLYVHEILPLWRIHNSKFWTTDIDQMPGHWLEITKDGMRWVPTDVKYDPDSDNDLLTYSDSNIFFWVKSNPNHRSKYTYIVRSVDNPTGYPCNDDAWARK